MQLIIEMSSVDECDAVGCAYNVDHACHARAITIGDGAHPGCDTFVETGKHVPDSEDRAGVGACKVSSCRYNQNLECEAGGIYVEVHDGDVECGTFTPATQP